MHEKDKPHAQTPSWHTKTDKLSNCLIDEHLHNENFMLCLFVYPQHQTLGSNIDISQSQQMVLKTDVDNRLMGLDAKLIKFWLGGVIFDDSLLQHMEILSD